MSHVLGMGERCALTEPACVVVSDEVRTMNAMVDTTWDDLMAESSFPPKASEAGACPTLGPIAPPLRTGTGASKGW